MLRHGIIALESGFLIKHINTRTNIELSILFSNSYTDFMYTVIIENVILFVVLLKRNLKDALQG